MTPRTKQLWTIQRLVPDEFLLPGQYSNGRGKVFFGKPESYSYGAMPEGTHVITIQVEGYDKSELAVTIDRMINQLEIMRRQVLKEPGEDE